MGDRSETRMQKQIKNNSTRSGIACLPGAAQYKTNQNDSANVSPQREKMFNKRNRSLVFEEPE